MATFQELLNMPNRRRIFRGLASAVTPGGVGGLAADLLRGKDFLESGVESAKDMIRKITTKKQNAQGEIETITREEKPAQPKGQPTPEQQLGQPPEVLNQAQPLQQEPQGINLADLLQAMQPSPVSVMGRTAIDVAQALRGETPTIPEPSPLGAAIMPELLKRALPETAEKRSVRELREAQAKWYKERAKLPTSVDKATAKYLAKLGDYETQEEALADLEIYTPAMEAEGVDPEVIKEAIMRVLPVARKKFLGIF